MRSFTLKSLEGPEAYCRLLEFLFGHAASCSVVVRPELALDQKGRHFLIEAEGDLETVLICSEWPGTKLLPGTASVYTFHLSPHFRNVFTQQASHLFDWVQPSLPEDPAFYRKDGSVLLGSVSHEQDAFIELSAAELAGFQENVGGRYLDNTPIDQT
jgi:hypothetical protein